MAKRKRCLKWGRRRGRRVCLVRPRPRFNGATLLTKAGKHGTLYRYAVRYIGEEEEYDPAGQFPKTWHTWAYDPDHAIERFYETDPDSGWKALDVKRVTS